MVSARADRPGGPPALSINEARAAMGLGPLASEVGGLTVDEYVTEQELAADAAQRLSRPELYVSLHTGPPDDDDQSVNECSYGGYARVAVACAAVVGTDTTTTVAFGQVQSGAEIITHFSVGTEPSGRGPVLFAGAVSSPVQASPGIAIQLGLNVHGAKQFV